MNPSNSIILSWKVDGMLLQHEVSLRENEVLVSSFFLHSLLPPNSKFLGLSAIIETDDKKSCEVNVKPRSDHKGNEHYLLDGTLSKTYRLVHSHDCVYVSDSMESVEGDTHDLFQFTSCGSKTSPLCVDDEAMSDMHFDTHEEDHNPIVVPVDTDDEHAKRKSIISWIKDSTGAAKLKSLLSSCGDSILVEELPALYDGTVCFELPPAFGKNRMVGMEQKFDGHLWSRPSQTNMSIECTIRLSSCLGSLICQRITCSYYVNEKKINNSFFHGHLDRPVSKGLPAAQAKSSITCHYCDRIVTCSAICICKIYYVFPKDKHMSRLAIHVGEHSHSVQAGTNRASIEKVRSLVNTVLKMESGGPRKIQMMVARQVLFDSLTPEDGEVANEKDLNHFLEEMMPLVQNKG